MKPNNKFLFFETNFDRSTKIRSNASELGRLINDPKTKHILLWKGKVLFNLSSDIPQLAPVNCNNKIWNNVNTLDIEHGSFIGFQDKQAIFYHIIPDWNDKESDKIKVASFSDESRHYHPELPDYLAFCEVRSLMASITETDAKIIASVKGIYEWNKAQQYCNNCGAKTIQILSGWEKKCSSCNTKHFPRTDPAVIMMIHHNNKALLGRSPIWPKGMFSCLAGFMEPGESIEAAVARETYEEAGVLVTNIKYVTSQPWPFPSSLMIGCMAEAKSLNISIDTDELEDARWFSKEEIRQAISTRGQWWPAREGSIARFLINQWINELS